MTRARSLVEAALLTGLSVMLYIGGAIPVLGMLLILLSPVPLVVLEMRHDLRTGLVALIVGSLLAAMLQGPITALSYTFGFALLGLALGRIIEMRRSAVEILAWGSLVSLLCKLALAVIMFYVTGVNIINMDMPAAEKMMDMLLKLPGSAEKVSEVKAMVDTVLQIMPLVIPSIFIMISVVDSYLCFWISGKVIRRLSGIQIPSLPPFNTWRFPASVLLAYLAALVCLIVASKYPDRYAFLTRVGLNLELLVHYLFILQGMALAAWWMDRKNMGRIFRNVILVMLFLIPMLSLLTTYAGMIDMCWNLRVRFGGDRR